MLSGLCFLAALWHWVYWDLDIFYDNLFIGVGPGQANILREKYGFGKKVAAHTEFSRMLAEHGILGLISLLILIGVSGIYLELRKNIRHLAL